MLRLATFPSVMKPSSRPSSASPAEPLESRIAPARVILVGVPDSISPGADLDVNYTDAQADDDSLFVNTESGDAISTAVGGGVSGVADTFYIKLSAGDRIQLYSSGGEDDLLQIKSGSAVAFFVDKNQNNEIDDGELTGLSLGKDASVVLKSALEGDIVANYDEASVTPVNMTSVISGQQSIKGITIGGGDLGTYTGETLVRGGSILAGGSISNVSVNGRVGSILTGTATVGASFDFFPAVANSGEGTIAAFTPQVGQAGGSITNVVVDGVVNKVQTGDGGAGAAGGSVTNFRVSEYNLGLDIIAGKGGDAGPGKVNGGAGGSISKIYLASAETGDTSANDVINITAGAGGASQTGAGGKGGSVSDLFASYRFVGTRIVPTDALLADQIIVTAGAGGDGKTGGAGGGVVRANVYTTANGAGDEVRLVAGDGGDSTVAAGGKAGAGGSVTDSFVRESFIGVGPSVVLQAGAGGDTSAGANRGAAGGSVLRSDLIASSISLLAGNGSAGTVGGVGGAVTNVSIDVGSNIFANNLTINAGIGGDSSQGKGAAGGTVSVVRVESGDFASLLINSGNAADGGNSAKGRGGAGGAVSNIDIFDSDFGIGTNGQFTLRTGAGGDGTSGGGAGGSVTRGGFAGVGINASVILGAGGDVSGTGAKGRGGVGGSLTSVEVLASGFVAEAAANVTVVAGDGGAGAGLGGAGGAGGGIKSMNARAEGAALVSAGDGGNGTFGAAGAGGSIQTTGVFASQGDGELIAGNAGVVGARPAKGGSIIGTPTSLTGLYSFADLTIQAGNGSHGGAGGSLKYVGYGSSSATLLPTPSGNITIQAGNGSVEGKFVGVGGALTNVSGAVSSGDEASTLIAAGAGGSSSLDLLAVRTTPGGGGVNEVQVLNFSPIAYSSSGRFTLSFGSDTTTPLALGGGVTPTGAAAIESALNGLNSVIAAGGVTVAAGPNNTYVVTFVSTDAQTQQIAVDATTSSVASAGGSISSLIVERGGGLDGSVVIQAGDGGDTAGSAGGKGGSVTRVAISNIGDETILRSIAAGDGGDGGTKGGVGGSITSVDVLNHDIGVRTGEDFGFTTMGGLFAGRGGTAGAVEAKAGSVTNITADMIAAIVAGRSLTPGLVEKVENIYLNGNQLLKDSEGAIYHTYAGAELILTFNGEDSAPIAIGTPASDDKVPDDEADDVEDILNDMDSIRAAGGVTVTGTFYGGYTVTFVTNGDRTMLMPTLVFGEPIVEETPGRVPLLSEEIRVGDNAPALQEQQRFSIGDELNFVLTFGGESTDPIARSATAAQVAAALNELETITEVGGVTVLKDEVNSRYVVTFNESVDIPELIIAEGVRFEQQHLKFYPDADGYTLTFDGETTDELPQNASASQVQDALNDLASVAASDANDPEGSGSVVVTDDGRGGFIVTFQSRGEQPDIEITQNKSFEATETAQGSPTIPEVQRVQVPDRVSFDQGYLQTANFVGGIANPLAVNPHLFHSTTGVGTFALGGTPIDGLIMTKVYVAAKTNFIPEALLVGTRFTDFNNLI